LFPLKKITALSQACILSLFFLACAGDKKTETKSAEPLFRLLSPQQTGIGFNNTLTEGLNTNVLMYEYFYNGGGVAVADLNGDGLQDIYFTANMAPNKLYLNKGRMQFEDITGQAGVAGREAPWKTGTTIVDINGDNKPDLFVCYSGKVSGKNRLKQLFINEGNVNGIPKFSEQSENYGLIDSSYTTHAVFFDHDRDGDLDLFLLNHNPNNLPILDESTTADLLKKQDPLTGCRLFQNDKGRFKDITASAGIKSSPLSYGLGAAVSDINGDGWPDIYICNDYAVPDYLYINNRKGGFTDQLQNMLGQTSHFSMGNNISDINNDGLQDIFTLDMLPEDNTRQKLLFAPDNYEKFSLNVRTGFYYQYMRNMLHINNGNGSFSEAAQLAGISNTDWSWAPLFADYDNDGWKDLYVTNGYVRDFTNMDFMKFMGDRLKDRKLVRQDILGIVKEMPSSSVTNYMYRNNRGLHFVNMGPEWGLDSSSNSNGAAYADLDNDGDLDLIVNNINQPAFVYENLRAGKPENNFLSVKLQGLSQNTDGIGAKISLFQQAGMQVLEQVPARGYQSSVSPVLHFGLGKDPSIDSLIIRWQSGKMQILKNLRGNKQIVLKEEEATTDSKQDKIPQPLFREIVSPINYSHVSNAINDFKRQPLIVNPLSFNGPCMSKADVNGDGREDIYVGGGNGKAGTLFIQRSDGKFSESPQPAFEAAKQNEDADAVFFDANKDGFIDLYVASGGYHNYIPADASLQDRLYLNDGKGNFRLTADALPEMKSSKSCVRLIDINADGSPDLFVGGRVIPGRYPEAPETYLLVNDGKGHFRNSIAGLAPSIQKAGMITDAAVLDMNGDKKQDLIVVGDWMPVTVLLNINGKLEDRTTDYFDRKYSGWWNRISVADLNKDGVPDLVIGNQGLNTQCRVTEKQPAELYYKDFDDNGSVDPVFCFYIQGKSYPYITRDELFDQMSMMRARFADYKTYSTATLQDIFTPEELSGATKLSADVLETVYFESGPGGKYKIKPLPVQAQLSPVYAIHIADLDNDGKEDMLLGGNINHPRLRLGKSAASYGTFLKGDGKGNFSYIPQMNSGLNIRGDMRSILQLGDMIVFGINQDKLRVYIKNKK
jgi:hypothetical protein